MTSLSLLAGRTVAPNICKFSYCSDESDRYNDKDDDFDFKDNREEFTTYHEKTKTTHTEKITTKRRTEKKKIDLGAAASQLGKDQADSQVNCSPVVEKSMIEGI